jgi:hypothetical protein
MVDLFLWLRRPEIEIGSFLFPWGMAMAAIGFVVAWGAVSLMEIRGWTRHVWNLPLFFVALAVLVGCVAGLIFAP